MDIIVSPVYNLWITTCWNDAATEETICQNHKVATLVKQLPHSSFRLVSVAEVTWPLQSEACLSLLRLCQLFSGRFETDEL